MTVAVVQRVTTGQPNGTASWTPTATLGSAPTQGNLLFAVMAQTNSGTSPVAASGWTVDTSFNNGTNYCTSFWKYAGVSEPTAQTPTTTSGSAGSLIVWEISGTPPTFSAARASTVTNGFGLAPQYMFPTTAYPNVLLLGATVGFTAASAGVGTASLSGTTIASQYNAVGGTGSVTMQATAGEAFYATTGGHGSDSYSYSLAITVAQIYTQFLTYPIPVSTEGVSKINAWAMIGPPTGVQVVSKITGYTMVGPRPNSAYVWVMS